MYMYIFTWSNNNYYSRHLLRAKVPFAIHFLRNFTLCWLCDQIFLQLILQCFLTRNMHVFFSHLFSAENLISEMSLLSLKVNTIVSRQSPLMKQYFIGKRIGIYHWFIFLLLVLYILIFLIVNFVLYFMYCFSFICTFWTLSMIFCFRDRRKSWPSAARLRCRRKLRGI